MRHVSLLDFCCAVMVEDDVSDLTGLKWKALARGLVEEVTTLRLTAKGEDFVRTVGAEDVV